MATDDRTPYERPQDYLHPHDAISQQPRAKRVARPRSNMSIAPAEGKNTAKYIQQRVFASKAYACF